jgi:hypothetical protein
MKHAVYLLSAGLLLSVSAHAQFGLRAGGNLSRLAIRSTQDGVSASNGARVGYEAGVFYQLPLGGGFSLVPELDFLHQSQHLLVQNYQVIDNGFKGDYRLTRSQLSLPVLARLSRGKWYLEAGPQLTYLLDGRQTGTETYYGFGTFSLDVDRPATDRFRRLDAGLCVGVGLQLPAGVGVSLRAYQGLRSTSIEPDTYTPYSQAYSGPFYQQTLQASLTYQLSPRQ